MLATITSYLAQHAPNLLGWLAAWAARAAVGPSIRAFFRSKAQKKAYDRAVAKALVDFAKQYPSLAASFFDEHFLGSSVADELLKLLTRNELPDQIKIVSAYQAQFVSKHTADVESATEFFISAVEKRFASEEALQELRNNRQLEESNQILRELKAGTFSVEATFDSAKNGPAPLVDESLARAFEAASQDLLNWPQDLGEKQRIDRPEFSQLASRVEGARSSVSLLLGVPGSGKSALLSHFAQHCMKQGWAVLGIKADQLPEEVESLDELQAVLDLSAPVVECLCHFAKSRKVVLLIDQLDALSELVDLNTQRLSVLLRLMNRVKNIENVHTVASCRTFDRGYDQRLASIPAEEINLELPPWEAVEEVLKAKGLSPAGWPEAFREILRVPQCLKLFLKHFSGTDEVRIFESYQGMLEHLWESRLFGSSAAPGASQLLHQIATDMAEREVMFVPAARYDADRRALDYVIGAGILQYDHTSRQISFTHQTIFDFARSRAFIANEQSLSKYVLARQTALFVRSKLWSTLHYLRGSDLRAYQLELKTMWEAQDLRPHLRMLLIDFVGQQEDPSQEEIQLLKPVFFDDRFAPNALAAIAGKKIWFDICAKDIFAATMRASNESAWATVRVLESALSFAKEKAIKLMEACWLPDYTKHICLLHVLRGLQEWSRSELEMAVSAVATGAVHNSTVHDLATLISVSAPALAPELVAAQIKKQTEVAVAARTPEPESAPSGSDLDEAIAVMERQRIDPLRKILEGHNEWYDISAIAEAAPAEYLKHLWPMVREAIEVLAKEGASPAGTYRSDHLLATNLEVDGVSSGYEHPFMDSFVFAVRSFAKQDPVHFQAFVTENESSESMTVHRLLAFGLCEIAEVAPLFVLRYLTSDPRRLLLENYHEDERETKMLLRALVPNLSEEQVRQLETYILEAGEWLELPPDATPKDRQHRLQVNRQFRMRLLLQFPSEKLSKDTGELLASEKRIFADFKDVRREFKAIHSRSPMDASAMERATDDTLRKFLDAYPDSTGWGDHFRNQGGSIEVSREFAKFAKRQPARAIALIGKLDPATHQRPAAYALQEWVERELPDDTLFALVADLDKRGFSGEEFRECAAGALRKRVKHPFGIPAPAIDILQKWVAEYAIEEKGEDAEILKEASDDTDRSGSILWGYGGIRILPSGCYTLLNAFFFGLIGRDPVPSDRLIDALKDHLDRRDRIEVWNALAGNTLEYLRRCEHGIAQSFLKDLFAAYPALLASHSGALLVAHSLLWVDSDLTKSWMVQIGRNPERQSQQVYGELLVLRSILRKEDSWSREQIEANLRSPSDGEGEFIFEGLVYGAVHVWKDAHDRTLLKAVLCAGMESSNKRIARAALDWFRVTVEIPFDADHRAVLEALSTGSALAAGGDSSYVLERICDLIGDAPDLVWRVAERLLDVNKQDVGNPATRSALEAESLLGIALTLQRQGEPHRTRGLELFEKLLHYNAYRARDVLMDIDHRPGLSMPATRLRRRRRTRPSSK